MKQKRYKYSYIFLAIFIPLLGGCIKETIDELQGINGIKVANTFSAPLLNLTMGMKELYEAISTDGLVTEQPNKLLVFAYQAKDTVPAKQFVAIPSMPFNYQLKMTGPMITAFEFNNGFNLSISDSAKLPATGNQRVKLINIKEGSFVININNTFLHNTTIDLTFPSIRKNGVPLSRNIPYVYGVDPNPMLPITIDLAGYDLDLTNGGFSYNTIPFTYSFGMVRNVGNLTTTNDVLDINQVFTIKSYNIIRGYLGKINVLTTEFSEKIGLFDQQMSGKISVKDPRLVIKVYNSYGMPLTGKISNLRVVGKDGMDLPVVMNPFKDTFSFNQPATPGEVAISEYVIDRTNSNLDLAINSSPSDIKFNLTFDANYNDAIVDNFLIDTARFNTDLNFEIPLNIKIEDYVSEQVAPQSAFGDIEYVEAVKLAIRAENGLPFDVYTQLLYANPDTNVTTGVITQILVDSLFETELSIPGASIDLQGEVIAPTITVRNPVISAERFKKISAAKNQITRSRLNTSAIGGAPGFAKIYTDQKMNIKIGADINIIYKSKK
ncbi:MAG: hypothetical protein V4590_07020 [Bacteroidota bacterium]